MSPLQEEGQDRRAGTSATDWFKLVLSADCIRWLRPVVEDVVRNQRDIKRLEKDRTRSSPRALMIRYFEDILAQLEWPRDLVTFSRPPKSRILNLNRADADRLDILRKNLEASATNVSSYNTRPGDPSADAIRQAQFYEETAKSLRALAERRVS